MKENILIVPSNPYKVVVVVFPKGNLINLNPLRTS